MSRMLIRLIVIAILASPFALAACSSPKAVIDSAIFDLGEMPQGQKIIHTFILKNTGKGDLTYKVKPC
jgi:hypothetical protein